jgi:hypothetical protein
MAKARVTNRVLIPLVIALPSEEKFRPYSIDAVGGVPVTPHPEVIAAALVVQVVIETAELPILKTNTGQTCPPGYRRGHDFHDHSHAPFLITKMGHLITNAKIKSFCFGESLRWLRMVELVMTV